MDKTQFLILEASPTCNLAGLHKLCPSCDSRRRSKVDTSRHLDAPFMRQIAKRFYHDFGFRGFTGFHYYNEPMLSMPLLRKVIPQIKHDSPQARFVLWTNGTRLKEPAFPDAKLFELIHISNYNGRDFGWLKRVVPKLVIHSGLHDSRRDGKSSPRNDPCLRPYTEFIVDHWGQVHICCQDWQGASSPGNVFDDDLTKIIERFIKIREAVSRPVLDDAAPKSCWTCPNRYDRIDDFDRTIATDARRDIANRRAGTITYSEAVVPNEELQNKINVALGKWSLASLKITQASPSVAPRRPLFAIVNTWMEADIIEATVRNCWEQGCDRVFLLDNDSPDDTVERAKTAGAELLENYHTDFFQNSVKYRIINEHIGRLAAELGGAWWMCLDADELPTGPHGLRIREYLAGLPTQFNVVGAYSFDHHPTAPLANLPGFHPADFQPYGMFRTAKFCGQRHWKHLLFIVDRDGLTGTWRGSHSLWIRKGASAKTEPTEALLIHHFMYRNRRDTEQRLRELTKPRPEFGGASRVVPNEIFIGQQGCAKKFRQLDLIYSCKWDQVEPPHSQMLDYQIGVPVEHWSKILSPADYSYPRWYSLKELQDAIARTIKT